MNISFFYLMMTISNPALIPFSVSNLTLFAQGPQFGKTFQQFISIFNNVVVVTMFSVFLMSKKMCCYILLRQTYMALLVYKNTTDASLTEAEIENRLKSAPVIGNGLILDSVFVNLMGMA